MFDPQDASQTIPIQPLPVILEGLRRKLAEKEPDAIREQFQLATASHLLKSTISLCPKCLSYGEAAVYSQEGKVKKKTDCRVHGLTESLMENDERFYFLSNKDRWGRCYDPAKQYFIPDTACCAGSSCSPAKATPELAPDFTDQMSNKTCTVLVEITNACNLACRVCYSDAEGDRVLPVEQFKEYIYRLIQSKGALDSIQLTGGEGMLHPEFPKILDWAYQVPQIKKIYLPTNGILFAQGDWAKKMQPYREKLMILLQFDSLRAEANQTLRAANLNQVRGQVLKACAKAQIPVQLTMTLAEGVNDQDIGAVIAAGIKHRNVKVIAFQPVTYSGRYDLPPRDLSRMTLSDVVHAVLRQSKLKAKEIDFVPIPCSHPNCGWITLFVRKGPFLRNILPYVDIGQVIGQVTNKTLLSTQELQSLVGTQKAPMLKRLAVWLGKKLIRSTDIFTLAIKPFMDRYTYDQDRISNCCHHMMDTKGNLVSFCEYNALLRPRDPWSHFPKRA